MYNRELETKPSAMRKHNEDQRESAKRRLADVALRKKLKKQRAKEARS